MSGAELVTILRRSLFCLGFSLVLIWFIPGMLVPETVRAGGAQPVLPGGSSIQPGEQTPIQMKSEIVTMTIRSATEADNTVVKLSPDFYGIQFLPVWFPAIAEVEADFTLKNPTSESVSTSAWFPLASALENVDWFSISGEIAPRIENLQVSVDGNPLEFAVSELPNPKGAGKPPLPWASFPVTVPGEAETVVHLSYMLPLQPSFSGIEMVLYYIFHTGAGWAGPIGQAELIVDLPYPASAATLAGIPSGSLRLPPYIEPLRRADLPSGAVLEGNQARWTWKDIEPSAEDDFAVWLLRPGKWQELETARAAVQTKPQDGQAWLNLGATYDSLLGISPDFPSVLSSSIISPGTEANLKAAELLPEHPAPHVGLALLLLAKYRTDMNAPPEVIQYAQDEFQIARELAARDPSWAKETSDSPYSLIWLEKVLNSSLYEAAALAEHAAMSTEFAVEATKVALVTPSAMPTRKFTQTATLTPKPTLTSTSFPSAASQPAPATPVPLSKPGQAAGKVQNLEIIVAAGLIGLVGVGYLAWKRWRKGQEN